MKDSSTNPVVRTMDSVDFSEVTVINTDIKTNTGNKMNTHATVQAKPRTASPKATGTGWKVAIMVASLAGMIGGWGVLAVDQAQNVASAQTQVVQPANAPATNTGSNTNGTSPVLRSVTGQTAFPSVVTRSRSSR